MRSYRRRMFCVGLLAVVLGCLGISTESALTTGSTAEQRLTLVVRVRVRVNKESTTRAEMPYIPTTVRIPFGNTVNMSVAIDWGDGTAVTKSTQTAPCDAAPDSRCLLHAYKTWGNYTIRVTSLYNSSVDDAAWNFGWADINHTWRDESDLVDVLHVLEWNISQIQSLRNTFAGIRRSVAAQMTIPSTLPSGVISTAGMFSQCTYCNNPNVSLWDMSNVIDISHMFSGATAFNQPLRNWNTSRVVDMSGIFLAAASFNQDISRWNTSRVHFMSHAFMGAETFDQPLALWDTRQVRRMDAMFHSARSFNQPIGTWNTHRVEQMTGMFFGALQFNQDIGLWNVSACASMELMFQGAVRFSRDLTRWDVGRVLGVPRAFATGAARFAEHLWPRFQTPRSTKELKAYYEKYGISDAVLVYADQQTTPAAPSYGQVTDIQTPQEIADDAWRMLHDPNMADLLAASPMLKKELERVYRLANPVK